MGTEATLAVLGLLGTAIGLLGWALKKTMGDGYRTISKNTHAIEQSTCVSRKMLKVLERAVHKGSPRR